MKERDDHDIRPSLRTDELDDTQSVVSVGSPHGSIVSEGSVTSSRFSIAPTEFTVALSERGMRLGEEGHGSSENGSDGTSTSAMSGKSRVGRNRRRRRKKPEPTLYDCVAGIVRTKAVGTGLYRHQLFTRPCSAAEYYFDKLRKGTGREDEDARLYWHRELDAHEPPRSDILWALHQHASHFLEHRNGAVLKFMDESALLSLGLLLMETMKEALTGTGPLAFAELADHASEEDGMRDSSNSAGGNGNGMTVAPPSEAPRAVNRKASERFVRSEKHWSIDDFLTDDEDEAEGQF